VEATSKTTWSTILRKSAWISIGIALVLILTNIFLPSLLRPIAMNISNVNVGLGGTFLGIILVAVLVLLVADFISPIKPLDRANSRFWIGRAFFDFSLAFLLGNTVTLPVVLPFFSEIGESRQPLNTLMTFTSGKDVFLMTLAAGGGFLLVVLLRYLSHSLPPGLFKFNFINLRKDFLFILLVSAGVFALSFAYDFLVSHLGINVQTQYAFDKKALDQYGLVFILLGGVIIGPICEEIFYRGYLLPLLSSKGKWFGLIVSSFIFAATHLYLAGLAIIFLMGLVLAISYQRRQNLLVSIGIHMANNFVAFAFLIIQARGGL